MHYTKGGQGPCQLVSHDVYNDDIVIFHSDWLGSDKLDRIHARLYLSNRTRNS